MSPQYRKGHYQNKTKGPSEATTINSLFQYAYWANDYPDGWINVDVLQGRLPVLDVRGTGSRSPIPIRLSASIG